MVDLQKEKVKFLCFAIHFATKRSKTYHTKTKDFIISFVDYELFTKETWLLEEIDEEIKYND